MAYGLSDSPTSHLPYERNGQHIQQLQADFRASLLITSGKPEFQCHSLRSI
jgi:hypothetical protein